MLLVGAACAREPGDEVTATTQAASSASSWPTLDKVTATPRPNDLRKNDGTQLTWNGMAAGAQTIERRGYAEFTVGENDTWKAAGLDSGAASADPALIDFGFEFRFTSSTPTALVRESGTVAKNLGSYAVGETFRVEIDGAAVKYWRRAARTALEPTPPMVLVHTTITALTFPYRFHAALRTPGATIRDVLVRNQPIVSWDPARLINAAPTPESNDLKKTDSSQLWTAGASSNETIERRGYVEFTTGEVSWKAAGLNAADQSTDPAEIDYAIYLLATGAAVARKSGALVCNLGTYLTGDVFRIQVGNGTVKYSKNGGTPCTTPADPAMFPLRFDASLRTPGATIQNVTMSTTRLHIATQRWALPASMHFSCGTNDVVSLNGSVLSEMDVAAGETPSDFAHKSDLDIEDGIDTYLGQHQEMAAFPGYLVLDIESPHLRGLGDDTKYTDYEKNLIVDGFVRRLRWARQKFPNARIGIYGTLNPDEIGNGDDPVFQERLAALIEAAKPNDRWGYATELVPAQGLYDSADFLVPIVYERFGYYETGWGTVGSYTKLGVDGTQALESSLPLMPFMTAYVTGSGSNFQNVMLMDLAVPNPLDVTIGAQLDTLAEEDVPDAAFWIGSAAHYDPDGPNAPADPDDFALDFGEDDVVNAHPWTIGHYTCGL